MYTLNRLPGYKIAAPGALARAKVKLYHGKAPCGRYNEVGNRQPGVPKSTKPAMGVHKMHETGNVALKFLQTENRGLGLETGKRGVFGNW